MKAPSDKPTLKGTKKLKVWVTTKSVKPCGYNRRFGHLGGTFYCVYNPGHLKQNIPHYFMLDEETFATLTTLEADSPPDSASALKWIRSKVEEISMGGLLVGKVHLLQIIDSEIDAASASEGTALKEEARKLAGELRAWHCDHLSQTSNKEDDFLDALAYRIEALEAGSTDAGEKDKK